MKLKSVRTFAGVGAVLALVLGITQPAYATPIARDSDRVPIVTDESSTPEPGLPIAIGASKDEAVIVGVTGDDEYVSPLLFDPTDSFQCDILKNPNHTITNYDMLRFDSPTGAPWITAGSISLLCGTDATSGFRHIRSRHQASTSFHPNSWESIRSSAISAGANPGIPWDDYMDHAIQDSIYYAMPMPLNIGNDKACFSTIFNIWVGAEVYSSWYVNTIVSVNNRLVITAYPSDSTYLSDCTP